MGQIPFSLFVFADFAIFDDAPNIRLHGRPVKMTRQRGKNFGVGDVLQVVVVLRDENVAERGRDENARREVGGFEHSETIAVSDRVRVEGVQEVEGGGNRRG